MRMCTIFGVASPDTVRLYSAASGQGLRCGELLGPLILGVSCATAYAVSLYAEVVQGLPTFSRS